MILYQGEAMCNAKRFYAELLLVKLRYCWNSSRFVIGTKLHVMWATSVQISALDMQKELHLVSLVGIMIDCSRIPTILSNTCKLNLFLYSVYLLPFLEFASFVVSSPKDDCHDYHEEKRHHWNILDQHKFTIALKQK